MAMHGFLCVNKPAGMTSRDVVNVVVGASTTTLTRWGGGTKPRRRDRPKIGHTGTLDPLAEGLLVIAIGAASRLTTQIGQLTKTYHATFELGRHSVTGDLEGPITEHPDRPMPDAASIADAAGSMIGVIEQTPSAYSAIKIDGRRAYDRVRSGETVAMPTRRVRVDRFDVTDYRPPVVQAWIDCGGGTYVRSLGEDLAGRVGQVAVMTRLIRTAVGTFNLDAAVDVDDLRDGLDPQRLLPLRMAVSHLDQFQADDETIRRITSGVKIVLSDDAIDRRRDADLNSSDPASDGDIAVTHNGDLRALAVLKNGRLQPKRVFPAMSDSNLGQRS